MGGDPETIERNQQWQNVSNELTEVKFYVHFADNGNLWLFDRNKVYSSICKKTSHYLDEYGIKNTDLGPVESGGGGGLETLLDIIKMLWENKDVIEFGVSFMSFLKRLWSWNQGRTERNLQPRMLVGFIIESTSPAYLLKDDLDFLLQKNLANLLTVSQGIVKKLSNDFEGFLFDIAIESRVISIDYTLRLSLPHEKQSSINLRRFFNIISSIFTRKNFSSSYSFTRWFTIKREDAKIIRSNASHDIKPVSTYYFFVSSTILKDKFKLFR